MIAYVEKGNILFECLEIVQIWTTTFLLLLLGTCFFSREWSEDYIATRDFGMITCNFRALNEFGLSRLNRRKWLGIHKSTTNTLITCLKTHNKQQYVPRNGFIWMFRAMSERTDSRKWFEKLTPLLYLSRAWETAPQLYHRKCNNPSIPTDEKKNTAERYRH